MAEYVNIHTHRPAGRGIELRAKGVHPWDAEREDTATLGQRLGDAQAVGETGLDFACDVAREAQTAALRAQLRLARERGLPVVLHCVRAFEPLMRELAACPPPAAIFHGFIGSPEQARQAVAKGYYLSFGERTFASRKTLEALREVPSDRLFFETDDSPAAIETIYARAAEVRRTTVEELRRRRTTAGCSGEGSKGRRRCSRAAVRRPHDGRRTGGTRRKRTKTNCMDNWLERTELLLGEEKLGRLRRAHVLVVGLGGVGAYAAEMIARAGVGRMTVADADTVNGTNINRQLVALHSTVGRPKAEVLAERLRDINPEIDLSVVNRYIRDEETYALLDAARYDYVVDAIDTLSPKLALIAAALERRLPLVSSMGAGAKTDPTRMEIADIAKTHHCPLAHMLRKRLHKIGIRSGFRAVFSPEPMREGAMILCEERNKKSNVGTISYIPPLFGIGCASVVIRGLIGELD